MRGTFLVAVSTIFPKIKSRANLLWTLHLSSQTEKQLVGDRVHQVQEGGVLVKDVVERRSFQAEILEQEKEQTDDPGERVQSAACLRRLKT